MLQRKGVPSAYHAKMEPTQLAVFLGALPAKVALLGSSAPCLVFLGHTTQSVQNAQLGDLKNFLKKDLQILLRMLNTVGKITIALHMNHLNFGVSRLMKSASRPSACWKKKYL